jgi:hypothetical protein
MPNPNAISMIAAVMMIRKSIGGKCMVVIIPTLFMVPVPVILFDRKGMRDL